MSKGRVYTILIVLLALAGLGMWGWSGEGDGSTPVAAARQDPLPASVTSVLHDYAVRGRELADSPPPSWRGTRPDGALAEDEDGNLIINEALRRRFDYVLSALGEEDLETLKARLAADFEARLSPSAAARAWALLQQYLGYREALAELTPPGQDPAALRQSLEQRQALRDRFFDAVTAEAFFGFEDRYADFALQRRRILEDEDLNEATRSERLDALEATLPLDLREQVRASREPMRVREEVRALREQGASQRRIDQLREQRLGREAADRLAELDQRRALWQARYQDYREQRRAILESGLAPSDQQAEIERLRERLFEAGERRRVEVLDRNPAPDS
ncbi:lipase secretion chaperone [Alloalcanivorax xenomutans]|uniref:Lipase chaperone n=1 Tax=Alloalcanivorax xenomutans TaxID=1094342 RepID=A0A9Q3W212_9GAMM|nr:lipase secretion chaperone [Alloalcanivorax xenomutans]MCE7507821.1 lipase secretion chaperone [Alloalcanivorax xenomutans]MCE7521493.1 lipase secretion chaperone [Alloalcanivorax xenomutans]